MTYVVPRLRTVNIDRYILPLREGGSIPGLAEGDDGHKYVIKFRGAAQGPKVLMAELIGGEIARALGLKVPELVFVQFDEVFGRTESDEELQNQFKASTGLNIGLAYLTSSNTFDPGITKVNVYTASTIVWLDSLIMNVDRTVRNPNMLIWNKELWLIDHGACLYFHYNWARPPAEQAVQPFPRIKDHVLLPKAAQLASTNRKCKKLLTPQVIHDIVAQIPDEWVVAEPHFHSAKECREAYEEFLLTRVANSSIFVKEAQHARKEVI